ncbi:hypothetical protein B4146_1912 [Bacillus subtilis]|nr:hypothetical protein B4146_1912 [Bacillus subtilis]
MLGLWNKESTAFSTDYLLQNFLSPSHLKGSSMFITTVSIS